MSEVNQKTIRLYRFMAAKWAMKSLESRELRVGRVLELNDPFESLPGIEGLHANTPLDLIRSEQLGFQTRFHHKFGLLSFSTQWKQPSLWGHYADSHNGIALGFDHEIDPNLHEVDYTEDRPCMRLGNLDFNYLLECYKKVLTTKRTSWKPETEYRAIISLERLEPRDGNYFLGIPDEFLVLVEVILGCRCSVEEVEVERVLKRSGFYGVRVIREKLSVNKYEVEC